MKCKKYNVLKIEKENDADYLTLEGCNDKK